MPILTSGKLKRLRFDMGVSYTNSFLGFIMFVLLARLLDVFDYSMLSTGI